MVRRSLLAASAATFFLALAPSALAQAPPCAAGSAPPCDYEHDSSRDGTPNEIVSGFYGGDDNDNSNGDPLADRFPNTFETYEFTVPQGSTAGNFTVNVTWEDPRIDLDLYVYRRRPDGGIVPGAIASSASFGDNTEDATYTPRILGQPVEPDTYVVVVDNWCSRDADDDPTSDDPADTADCGIGEEVPNEDDFVGSVRLGAAQIPNRLPTVTLSGPDGGRTGTQLNYTAQASDPDGSIVNYRFDLNGDGFFETNTLTANVATAEFDRPGIYNVGVQATDNAGDTAYASKAVRVTGPPRVVPRQVSPLLSFKLSNPVFGGRRNRSLVVRYRLRERSRVTLTLYRGKKRVRRLDRGSRRANRTFRFVVNSRRMRRGRYNVRINVRTQSGDRQRARLSAKRL